MLQTRIGEGGTATVYRAQDTYLNRPVAVKVLRAAFASDEQFVRRFRREARAAAALSHPNIVAVYDVGVEGEDLHYIVMEFVDGETLKDFIQRSGQLPVAQAGAIATTILDVLDSAHRAGVIHCDVKPHNVLLTREGRIKVADFGIARATATMTLAATGSVIGTAHYVSPEQAAGRVPDERTDVYSTGVTLYEMLSGRVPFDGEGALAVALRHVHDEPPPLREWNPAVPEAVERVVDRAMAKDPDDRYATASDFRDDLTRALEGRAIAPRPSPARPSSSRSSSAGRQQPRRRRVRRWVWVAAGALVVGSMVYSGVRAASAWLNVPTVVIPDVVGESRAQAAKDLRAAHLAVRVTGRQHASTAAGSVVGVAPAPGTTVRQGRTIDLTLSSGPSYLAGGVPNVVGTDVHDARLEMDDAGLTVAATHSEYSATVPKGDVVATIPAAAARIAAGGKVTLIVSEGPKPTPFSLPDLVGQTMANAGAVLQSRGLVEGKISYAQGVWPAGDVSASAPPPKTTVKPGDAVDLTVSSGCVHTSSVTLVPRSPGPKPVQVVVTVTDQAGGPRTAFRGAVAPQTPIVVNFCWTGNVARWAEYENGAAAPSLQGVLFPS